MEYKHSWSLEEEMKWLEAKLCDLKREERIVVNALAYLQQLHKIKKEKS